MAAVENILAINTSPRKDIARAPSKVPFAPILASRIEARLSDLATPRTTQPVNTDRFGVRSDPVCDDSIRRDEHYGAADDTPRTDHTRDDKPNREDMAVHRRESKPSTPHQSDEKRLPQSEAHPNRPEPAKATETDASPSKSARDTSEAPKSSRTSPSETTAANSQTKTRASEDTSGVSETSSVTASPTAVMAELATIDTADKFMALDAVAAFRGAATASNGDKPMSSTTALWGATKTAPVGGAGNQSGAPAAPLADDPASASKSDGKINIAGMTPSNDETPSKIGSNMPQIVRDVQRIVVRPANADGGNLVQAQQQGNVPVGQNLITPTQASNAAPLSQNAGQGTPLHVGANAGGNAGGGMNQNAGQNAGHSASNPNGQGTNAQGALGQTGIASVQSADLPGAALTPQQAAQSFQTNPAHSGGPAGAGTSSAISGDGATMARGDGAIGGTGASQGTLASDSASRAAQTGVPSQTRNAPAADQVSVSLKKAVENGDSKLRIQLRPHELGRVEVKLDIAGDGRAKAMVLAERPETLELLQRDSRILERALQDAGLKTDHNSLSFDLQRSGGEEHTRQAQSSGAEDKGSSAASRDDGDDNEITEQPIPATAIGLAPDGSVNLLA